MKKEIFSNRSKQACSVKIQFSELSEAKRRIMAKAIKYEKRAWEPKP